MVASEHPELVRSLTLAEPAIGVLLMETPEAKPALDDRGKAMASIVAAVKAGDAVQATKVFFDWVKNQGARAVDKQPEAVRLMVVDNAKRVPLVFAAPSPPAIFCAPPG